MYPHKLFINNCWVDSISGKTFTVHNPADMSVVAEVPYADDQDTMLAIQAAENAFPQWSAMLPKERSKILRKMHELMLTRKESLARMLVSEQGKAISEARAEIDYSASFLEWFAEEGKRVYGDIVPSVKPGQKLFTFKQPIGVVGAITPWNFPVAMIIRKLASALAAGCVMVLKPSEETPLSAIAISAIALEAGLPAGVLNIVFGDAIKIGQALTSSDSVRMLTFTGSTRVGKLLMQECAKTVKKVSLELGGNAPFIVFEDADIEKAVMGLIASKLRNGGQSCICANRIYLHQQIQKEFIQKLKLEFAKIKVGDGLDETVRLGPLINKQAVEKIEGLIKASLAKGSEIIYQASIDEQKKQSNCFVAPQILVNTSLDTEIEKTEIFGPVVSIFVFADEDEVIKRANATNYGLASYVFTKDMHRIWRVSEQLEYGMVAINDVALSTEMTSFGGIKESGIGREGGKLGIHEYLEDKFIAIA
jgi:succinate-semialdehyde dehydrogenase / glutarate-semialdehyde dehydrogenase